MKFPNKEAKDWYDSRPKKVKEKIRKYPPDKKYRLNPTGQIVQLYSYSENKDGSCDTCQVLVLNKNNPNLAFERRVFGIKFEDLTMIED